MANKKYFNQFVVASVLLLNMGIVFVGRGVLVKKRMKGQQDGGDVGCTVFVFVFEFDGRTAGWWCC